jgi:hypothetical protein
MIVMRTLFAPLTGLLSRFRRDERGSIMAETIIILPLLIWATIAMVAYWDVYRSINRLQSATYAVGDVLSRKDVIDPAAFIPRMDDLVNYFIDDDQTSRVRVTVIRWVPANNRFEVVWSRSTIGTLPPHTTSTLQAKAQYIPMVDTDLRALVVESEVDYRPALNLGINDWIGVGDQTIRYFSSQPLRNGSGKLCLTTMAAGTC